jgi:hypothetical protein
MHYSPLRAEELVRDQDSEQRQAKTNGNYIHVIAIPGSCQDAETICAPRVTALELMEGGKKEKVGQPC